MIEGFGCFIDGDLKSGKGNCEFHCSLTIHPARVGGEWLYGCKHPAWPQNRYGDFVPIVNCKGSRSRCEIVGTEKFAFYKKDIRRRLKNAEKKFSYLQMEFENLEKFEMEVKNVLS